MPKSSTPNHYIVSRDLRQAPRALVVLLGFRVLPVCLAKYNPCLFSSTFFVWWYPSTFTDRHWKFFGPWAKMVASVRVDNQQYVHCKGWLPSYTKLGGGWGKLSKHWVSSSSDIPLGGEGNKHLKIEVQVTRDVARKRIAASKGHIYSKKSSKNQI